MTTKKALDIKDDDHSRGVKSPNGARGSETGAES
jgi:hypothetical protein